VPAAFGMNFQAVSVAQKLKGNGYQDGQARPSAGLAAALDATDAALGRMVTLLDERHLRQATVLVVTAKHGQTPIDPAERRIVDGKLIGKTIERVAPGLVGQITTDDVALVWLRDHGRARDVVEALRAKAADLAIAKLWSGDELVARFGDPASDPRVPDLIVQPQFGVIYTKPTASKIAEHGGLGPNDRGVALLIANPALPARSISVPVSTVQVAPTILALLGIDPQKLDAVRLEGTQILPGLAELAVGR
jgi:arylsulfatase A-like enzyme